MTDLLFEQALGLRDISPETPPPDGCEGAGRCHGCVVHCPSCGDVSRVCDAPERCDRHRPLTDARVDWLIRYWLVDRCVEQPLDLARAVSDDLDEVLPPPIERARERPLALMSAGKIVVREHGQTRWIGGVLQ